MVLVDIDDDLKKCVSKFVEAHSIDFPSMKNFCDKAIRKELERWEKEK